VRFGLSPVEHQFYDMVMKLMKIILTMRATNAISERSFSALRCMYLIIASADYTSIATNLRFGLNSRKQCVQIPVINDMVPETQEYFQVKVAMTIPLPGIVLTPDTATIVINDDDGKCELTLAVLSSTVTLHYSAKVKFTCLFSSDSDFGI